MLEYTFKTFSMTRLSKFEAYEVPRERQDCCSAGKYIDDDQSCVAVLYFEKPKMCSKRPTRRTMQAQEVCPPVATLV